MHRLRNTWATGMPWGVVNECIDATFNYDIPQSGKDTFNKSTGRTWDNLDDFKEKSLKCPRCRTDVSIPWTTCGLPEDDKSPW